ncbi:MAG: peptide-methionine (S)-S-oxide reductase MsrA [Elusimicrobia bacterium]|nr:peptide-methionine (S)-S-oxide reductase MsrA [Elusimicrobiota bacterium]
MLMATFAAGCFWGVEAAFRAVPGVVEATAGYTGGTSAGPTYEKVCSGSTGHAEAVRVRYDPEKVSYAKLLETFWGLGRPGRAQQPGYQYRSAIFWHDDGQRREARVSMAAQEKKLGRPVGVELAAAGEFWPAEEYHQNYYGKKTGPRACAVR